MGGFTKPQIVINTVFLLVTIGLKSHAQEKDTIFYDTNWVKTSKAYASYYRPLPLKKVDSLFLIKDYYSNGQLQMEGLSEVLDKAVFSGAVKWYYPNGNLQVVRHYKNQKQNGIVQRYYNDGTLKTEGTIINNARYNGTFAFKAQSPTPVLKYKDGAVVERLSYYESTKTVAERQFIVYHDQVSSSVFYTKKGKEIARVSYETKSGNYLAPKSGKRIHFSYSNTFLAKKIIAKTTYTLKDNDLLEEISYTPKNKIIASGIRKGGHPLKGSFLDKGVLSTYANGKKQGEQRCCLGIDAINITGTYKDNKKYDGSFFNTNSKTKTTYKAGVKHGEEVTYNDAFGIIGLKTYNNGILDGKYISINKHQPSITYTGYYKNGVFHDGLFFIHEHLKRYKNGKLYEDITYNYESAIPLTSIGYDSIGRTQFQTSFKAGKAYTLYYKDGVPHEGVTKDDYNFITYKDGSYNGPFIIYDEQQTIKGNYKDFEYNGDVWFIQKATRDTLTCSFESGQPIDGINCFNGKINYRAGKKHGWYTKQFNNKAYAFDALTGYYENDIKTDTITYFKNKERIAYGIYKAGAPFHGTFYDPLKLQNFSIYDTGLCILKETYSYYGKYRRQYLYKNGNISQENVFLGTSHPDSLKYQLVYQDKQPYSGTKFVEDSFSSDAITTPYKAGKKHGLETHYRKPFGGAIVKQFRYKNGRLEGKATYHYPYNKDSITSGVFKKGMPFQGEFVTTYRGYLQVAQYNKGELQQKAFYNYSKFGKNHDFIHKITYKNGKAYNGTELLLKAKKISAKAYKNGQLTTTHLNLSLQPYSSNKTILHTALKDSLVSSSNYNYAIHYNTPKKVSGTISYYFKTKACGTISFKNNTITQVRVENYNKTQNNGLIDQLYLDTKGRLINSIQFGNYKIERKLPTQIQGNIHDALGNFKMLQTNHKKMTLTIFLDNKAITQIEMRNDKPYQGILFQPEKDKNTYKLQQFKTGSTVKKLKGLDKAALLETVHQLKEN